jgi:hypothetical protein
MKLDSRASHRSSTTTARELATDAAHDAQLQGHPVIVGAAGTLLEHDEGE